MTSDREPNEVAARTGILALPPELAGLKSPWWKGLPKNDRELFEDFKRKNPVWDGAVQQHSDFPAG